MNNEEKEQECPKERRGIFRHIPVPLLFISTYLIGATLQFTSPLKFHLDLIFIKVIGAVLLVVGSVFAGWSFLIFLREHTTPIPGNRPAKLIMHGPYQLSRNPMYVGVILAYIGIATVQFQVFSLILLPFPIAYIHWFVIPFEEQLMKKTFKEEFDKYRTKVRRWI